MNYAVQSGRLTPAFVTPVTATIRKHDGEITDRADARSGEGGAGVGVSPGVTAVGGLEDVIGVVVRETSASFVHAGDVHVACRDVPGNLDVTDEGTCVAHQYRAMPRGAVISREGDGECARTYTEIVPRDIHPSVVWRGRIVISPAGLAVVAASGVNAKMSPAIWIPGSGGLESA